MGATPSEGTPRGAPPLGARAQRVRCLTSWRLLGSTHQTYTPSCKEDPFGTKERVDTGLPILRNQHVSIGTGRTLPSKSGGLKRMHARGERRGVERLKCSS